MSISTAYEAFVMAMERVERRLKEVTAALDEAGIPYAVVGGNAVAAWVATVDPAATRTTKDVDILVRRADLGEITQALTKLGYRREDLRDLVIFVDPDEPSRRSGIHLVWAGEKVHPSYALPTPDVAEVVREPAGWHVWTGSGRACSRGVVEEHVCSRSRHATLVRPGGMFGRAVGKHVPGVS